MLIEPAQGNQALAGRNDQMTRTEVAAKVAKQTQTACAIELVKGEGYWYFTASDVARNIYESQTEYVMYLSDMMSSEWVNRGSTFVANVEAEYAERNQ